MVSSFPVVMININDGVLHLELGPDLAGSLHVDILSLGGGGPTSSAKAQPECNGGAAPGEEGGAQDGVPLQNISLVSGSEVFVN